MPAGVDDDYAREIGRAIAETRRMRGMTQEALRCQVGNSKNAVSNWERGVSAPTVQNLRALCRALEVSPEQLLGMDGPAAAVGPDDVVGGVRSLARQLGELRRDAERAVPDLIQGLRDAEETARRIGGVSS